MRLDSGKQEDHRTVVEGVRVEHSRGGMTLCKGHKQCCDMRFNNELNTPRAMKSSCRLSECGKCDILSHESERSWRSTFGKGCWKGCDATMTQRIGNSRSHSIWTHCPPKSSHSHNVGEELIDARFVCLADLFIILQRITSNVEQPPPFVQS